MSRRFRMVLGVWICRTPVVSFRLRARLLRLIGMTVEARASIGGGGLFTHPGSVSIGTDSYVNHRCTFDGSVHMGDRVFVGPGCSFLAVTHEPGSAGQRAGAPRAAPIVVGDGAWIGGSATVLAGVTIGSGAVVAAGAVVASDCEPHGLYAGVPATRKRRLPSPGEQLHRTG